MMLEKMKEELDKRHRCVKCKHWSAKSIISDPPGPVILGSCTKCNKDIFASDPFNSIPCWCPGYEAFDKKYVTCPVCGGTGLNKNVFKITDDDGIGGCYPSCETCHGTGILEKIVVPDEEEVDGHMECISDEVNETINVKADPTNPNHYKTQTSLECIEAMQLVFDQNAVIDFCVCNAWKYIWRWKNKNGLEDLEKAKWYIEKAWELIGDVFAVAPRGKYSGILKRMRDYINANIRNYTETNKEKKNED